MPLFIRIVDFGLKCGKVFLPDIHMEVQELESAENFGSELIHGNGCLVHFCIEQWPTLFVLPSQQAVLRNPAQDTAFRGLTTRTQPSKGQEQIGVCKGVKIPQVVVRIVYIDHSAEDLILFCYGPSAHPTRIGKGGNQLCYLLLAKIP